jgi:hypothetical protein
MMGERESKNSESLKRKSTCSWTPFPVRISTREGAIRDCIGIREGARGEEGSRGESFGRSSPEFQLAA